MKYARKSIGNVVTGKSAARTGSHPAPPARLARLLAAGALLLAGCGGAPLSQISLMPAPEVYEEGKIDPFLDNDPISRGELPQLLYATDRAPAAADDDRGDRHYTDERGGVLRLGAASVRLGVEDTITWEEARRISLLKNRTEDYPLEVDRVVEYGALASTIRPFDDRFRPEQEPGRRFSAEIDRQLERSGRRDVFIYVHGYKVVFENPILVATELWHFLGYQGAFVAFSWPSTPSTFRYFSDLEDAQISGRSLRSLILHIAGTTEAERIHVLGYSAGTRVVTKMLGDLGMFGYLRGIEELKAHTKLGNVILVGSDVDQEILAGYLLDGGLRVPDSLTIYQSSTDKALGMSRFVFGRDRSGQVVDRGHLGPRAREFFAAHPEIRFINISGAEGSATGNGHGYFRSSPWVSSDVLMTLMYDLAPAERGLVRDADGVRWRFSADYIDRLRGALARANPAFAERSPR
ncbi:MAG TPA: alpha/beta hydrolase [Woeseiaceae bacterium]|nr:alpha/beta hydrolase [Woeseiaceae bacterium]